MKFTLAALSLALAVSAMPNAVSRREKAELHVRQMSVGTATDVCGNVGTDLSCCNEGDDGDKTAVSGVGGGLISGVLSNIFGTDGISVLNGCAKISVVGLIGLDDLVNTRCGRKMACCEQPSQVQSGGLINLGLPCIALAGIL